MRSDIVYTMTPIGGNAGEAELMVVMGWGIFWRCPMSMGPKSFETDLSFVVLGFQYYWYSMVPYHRYDIYTSAII